MSMRTRKYVALVVLVILAAVVTRVTRAAGWSRTEIYGVGVGVSVLVSLTAMFWMEMAPDGAWGRRPERRPPA
jgi:hypothetical protein